MSKRFSREPHGRSTIFAMENILMYHGNPPEIKVLIVPESSLKGWVEMVAD
jgi:hypothetical protein